MKKTKKYYSLLSTFYYTTAYSKIGATHEKILTSEILLKMVAIMFFT
jgi:hypothetical protein